jgi:hypothetical protein
MGFRHLLQHGVEVFADGSRNGFLRYGTQRVLVGMYSGRQPQRSTAEVFRNMGAGVLKGPAAQGQNEFGHAGKV